MDCVTCILMGMCMLCTPDMGASERGRPMTRQEVDLAVAKIVERFQAAAAAEQERKRKEEEERENRRASYERRQSFSSNNHHFHTQGIGKRSLLGVFGQLQNLFSGQESGGNVVVGDSHRRLLGVIRVVPGAGGLTHPYLFSRGSGLQFQPRLSSTGDRQNRTVFLARLVVPVSAPFGAVSTERPRAVALFSSASGSITEGGDRRIKGHKKRAQGPLDFFWGIGKKKGNDSYRLSRGIGRQQVLSVYDTKNTNENVVSLGSLEQITDRHSQMKGRSVSTRFHGKEQKDRFVVRSGVSIKEESPDQFSSIHRRIQRLPSGGDKTFLPPGAAPVETVEKIIDNVSLKNEARSKGTFSNTLEQGDVLSSMGLPGSPVNVVHPHGSSPVSHSQNKADPSDSNGIILGLFSVPSLPSSTGHSSASRTISTRRSSKRRENIKHREPRTRDRAVMTSRTLPEASPVSLLPNRG